MIKSQNKGSLSKFLIGVPLPSSTNLSIGQEMKLKVFINGTIIDQIIVKIFQQKVPNIVKNFVEPNIGLLHPCIRKSAKGSLH